MIHQLLPTCACAMEDASSEHKGRRQAGRQAVSPKARGGAGGQAGDGFMYGSAAKPQAPR